MERLEEAKRWLMQALRDLEAAIFHIPSRYPNAFESGYPALYYDKITGERAIGACKRIIEWVRERLRLLELSE